MERSTRINNSTRPNAWLPTTKKEVEARGWDYLDVIIFSGDAYVDHPSFGAAVIGRVLESQGLRVAIVPQPDWRGDFRDFTKLGKPRMFFAVAPGAMDSMINHYTANKRLRSNDAYTPDNRAGMRPDYPSIVYTEILKKLYPDSPVILGGIEASLRRLAHYDYWQDKLLPGILAESPADLLIYGMGEKPVIELVKQIKSGIPVKEIKNMPQICFISDNITVSSGDLELFSYEECLKDKIKQAKNFKVIEEESNKIKASRILQKTKNQIIVANPPYPPCSADELDSWYDLPFTRLPHPKYNDKTIAAYEMIRHSVTIHRGCFGGCAFCTISAHQGKHIISRSKASILKEVEKITEMPDFKGYISDLGGPSANMYKMNGKDESLCQNCKKPSCAFPNICKNLSTDHAPLLQLYEEAKKNPKIKKIFIGSGVRYDLLLNSENKGINNNSRLYIEALIKEHVSGRLKVAPEHTEQKVLQLMRKPPFSVFEKFKIIFDKINMENNLKEQLIPYFISSHPGCSEVDMAELAVKTKKMNYHLEQVQDFTPSPMTLATEIFYTGVNPYNVLEKITSAKTKTEKLFQRQFFFWYLDENRKIITQFLQRIKRNDLINKLFN
jgi:uncharacterized radical SAM protein YgiQ